jgi:glycosyltransferase involved in cell wall biosynthesis
MKISVIIPTYNEGSNLKMCIESLKLQSYSDFEIIVVDDGSTDTTAQILKDLKLIIPKFYFSEQKHLGTGSARNFGAKMATGKILVFVDADMTFDKNFLLNLVKPIENGKSNGTFSKEEYVSNWDNNWARCWNINENWETNRRHSKKYPDHQPVFRAILKNEFDKVGGFTPGGYDDDWSLSRKLGYEAIAAPGAIFYHKNPDSLREIFISAKWAGKRKYKYGYFGYLIGLTRSLFPLSLVIGISKSLKHFDPAFVIFKIVYDLGIFFGILEILFTGKSSK